jgi:hypothetical protein
MSELWGILCKKYNFNTNASVGFIIGKNTTLGLHIKYVEDKTQSLWNASFSFVSPSVRTHEITLMPLDLYSYKILYSGVCYNERCYNERCYNERCYNERCYNERCYNERTLQRTIFVNKIGMLQLKQMLQRTQKNTIGRRSTRVSVMCLPALIRVSVIIFVIVCKVQLSA